MRTAKIALAAVALLGLAVLAQAEDSVTMKGRVVCAKCTLKKPGLKECQNVLLVADTDGQDVEYFIVKNDVDAKFGEACMDVVQATVTGIVSEKDGQKWIKASRMEREKS